MGSTSLLNLLDRDRDPDARRGPRPARGVPWHARSASPIVTYGSALTRAGHVLLVAMGWVAFGMLWARVLARPGASDAIAGTAFRVVGLAVVVTTVTVIWIQHNVALARRRGGRRSGSAPLVLPERDLLGRVLLLDPALDEAALVVVEVDEVGKTFSARSTDG